MALGDVVQNIGFSIWATEATLPGSAVVGNSIVVISNADDAGLACSDDLNGAYTKIATLGSGPRISIFLATNTSAASAPVITLSASGRRSYAMELEGDLTPAAGTGELEIAALSAGPTTFATSANDIPANSVSIAAWASGADGGGLVPDSPWTGAPGDNITYPFFIRQDASAVAGATFSGTYDGFNDTYAATILFLSLVSATSAVQTIRKGSTLTVDKPGTLGTVTTATLNAVDVFDHLTAQDATTATFAGAATDEITTSGEYDLVLGDGTVTETITVQVNVVGLASFNVNKDGADQGSLTDVEFIFLTGAAGSRAINDQIINITTTVAGDTGPIEITDTALNSGDTIMVAQQSTTVGGGAFHPATLELI